MINHDLSFPLQWKFAKLPASLRKSLRKMASGKVNGLGISSPGRASKEESGRRGRRNWEEIVTTWEVTKKCRHS